MKELLLGFTAFAFILTGCQKSEVTDNVNTGDNQLKFGVYQGKATKGAELTNDLLKKNGVIFPLYAYKGKQADAQTVYFADSLSYAENPGEWSTLVPRFLPDQDYLQFYAYYPATGVTAYATGDLAAGAYPTFAYEVQQNAAGASVQPNGTAIDFVAATVNDHRGQDVVIPMKHILSQINFGVKGYYGAKIKVFNLKINNVYKAGTFNMNPTVWSWTNTGTKDVDYTYTSPEFITPGFFISGQEIKDNKYTDKVTPWKSATAADKVAWKASQAKSDESSFFYILGDGGKWGPGRGENIRYVTGATRADTIGGDRVTDATTTLSNSLMLMPQAFTAGASNVTFDYTIQDLDGAYIVGSAGTPEIGTFDLHIAKETPDKYENKWQPNLRYLYIIDFTGYLEGQKLKFEVDVDTQPWENYNKPGDGTVLLSSLGEPVFKTSVKDLAPTTGNYDVKKGSHVFSDITWDWAPYTMNRSFAVNQTFTVKFTDVNFNGNKVTVTAPFGFQVSNDATTYAAEAIADGTHRTLTFQCATLPYYGNSPETALSTAIVAAGYECNVSNTIDLTKITTLGTLTAGNKLTLHFVAPYTTALPTTPAGWSIDAAKTTVTYTAPTLP